MLTVQPHLTRIRPPGHTGVSKRSVFTFHAIIPDGAAPKCGYFLVSLLPFDSKLSVFGLWTLRVSSLVLGNTDHYLSSFLTCYKTQFSKSYGEVRTKSAHSSPRCPTVEEYRTILPKLCTLLNRNVHSSPFK